MGGGLGREKGNGPVVGPSGGEEKEKGREEGVELGSKQGGRRKNYFVLRTSKFNKYKLREFKFKLNSNNKTMQKVA